jgi:hypothetical protein
VRGLRHICENQARRRREGEAQREERAEHFGALEDCEHCLGCAKKQIGFY